MSAGIGFDDLRYSASLGKVLLPAGRAGSLVLLDPATRGVTAIEGFSPKREYGGGHDDGVTSADAGSGWVFATDRTSRLLAVIDPLRKRRGCHRLRPEAFAPLSSRSQERHDGRRRRVAKGELSLLGTMPEAPGAHCVAADGSGDVFVCDPKRGRLLIFEDKYR